jgi:hypothetical protein
MAIVSISRSSPAAEAVALGKDAAAEADAAVERSGAPDAGPADAAGAPGVQATKTRLPSNGGRRPT